MIVLLAGGIAAGKTTVAQALVGRFDARLVRVREALSEVTGQRLDDRSALQRHGADLDRRTAGRWLAEYLADASEDSPRLVVDSCRTRRQAEAALDRLPDSRLVYLQAHETTRRARYALSAAADPVKAGSTFDASVDHDTERLVGQLRPLSHLVIDTDGLTPREVVDEIAAALGLPKDDHGTGRP